MLFKKNEYCLLVHNVNSQLAEHLDYEKTDEWPEVLRELEEKYSYKGKVRKKDGIIIRLW